MVRWDPGAETRPDEESVVKEKHDTLLRYGSRGITIHLKHQQTLTTIPAAARDHRKHTYFNKDTVMK